MLTPRKRYAGVRKPSRLTKSCHSCYRAPGKFYPQDSLKNIIMTLKTPSCSSLLRTKSNCLRKYFDATSNQGDTALQNRLELQEGTSINLLRGFKYHPHRPWTEGLKTPCSSGTPGPLHRQMPDAVTSL